MAAKDNQSGGQAKDEALNARMQKRREWWKKHHESSDGKLDNKDTKDGKSKEKGEKKVCQKKELTEEKSAQSQEKIEVGDEAGKKKERYILFIGNLPFSATVESVKEHFKSVDKVLDFRMLSKKTGGPKGCGFLELDGPAALAKAMKFHHTVICARKINVEVTCGGGGNSDTRTARLKFKNKRKRVSRANKVKEEKDKSKIKSNLEKNDETKICHSETGEGDKSRIKMEKDGISEDVQEGGERKKKRKKKKKVKEGESCEGVGVQSEQVETKTRKRKKEGKSDKTENIVSPVKSELEDGSGERKKKKKIKQTAAETC